MGHLCHGYSAFGAAQTQLSNQLAAKMSEIGKNMTPLFSSSANTEGKTLKHQGSTLFASVNSYMKKWGSKPVAEDHDPSQESEEFEAVNLND